VVPFDFSPQQMHSDASGSWY